MNRVLLFLLVLILFTPLMAGAQIAPKPSSHSADAIFAGQLARARGEYFKDVEGDRAAGQEARKSFAALSAKRPGDPVIQAYSGSIELLDAARTWAVWNKRSLARQGLDDMDSAVDRAPDNLDARFIRAASDWYLPLFYKRREQAERDFAYIAPRAESAAAHGLMPPQLAAAALDYYGQVLSEQNNPPGAQKAFETALRIDGPSPAGRDAAKRLGTRN